MKSPLVRPLSFPLRAVSALLILVQPFVTCPVSIAELEPTVPEEPAPHRTFAPEDVAAQVNRTLPEVAPPQGFTLSREPSDDEIQKCGLFPEPLVPMEQGAARKEDKNENADLSLALHRFADRKQLDDVSVLLLFCELRTDSRWEASLRHNLGLIAYNTGYFSQALIHWERAWLLGRLGTLPQAIVLANESLAQLMRMNARLGRVERLRELLAESGPRQFTGNAASVLADTKDALAMMQHDPAHSFRCGPLALAQIRTALKIHDGKDSLITAATSTSRGCSLAQVAELATAANMSYQIAKRDPGAAVITPAVVHWKVDHYAALLRGSAEQFLAKDFTFGNNTALSQQALDAEASGYFLIPAGVLPQGWHVVSKAEAEGVWGCGQTFNNQPGHTSPNDPDAGCPPNPSGSTGSGGGAGGGMAVYNVKAQEVSLSIFDTPVGYRPPVGPAVRFIATYSQRESGQPATFTYSNLGPNWLHDWLAYVVDNSSAPGADAKLFVRGGGFETLSGYDGATATYAWDLQSNTMVARISANQYNRYLRDGSVEVYGQPNNVSGPGRQIFLTKIIDPRGNALTLTYDNMFRLAAVKDAIGQVSTLSYGLGGDPYKITKVTDPFGRFASMTYTTVNGVTMLSHITDVIGIVSGFTYQGSFINRLTTPYGDTTFSFAEGFGPGGTGRSLDVIDPLGGHERTEYNQGVSDSFSDTAIPAGMNLFNQFLNSRDTYFWSKEAMMLAPGDYTKAKQYHFQHTPDGQSTSGLLESVREGLESRVWMNYPGQNQSSGFQAGVDLGRPSLVGRVLDPQGTTQLDQYLYNDMGNVTKHVDPQGRQTSFTYAANQIDLMQVQQSDGKGAPPPPTSIKIVSPRLPRGSVVDTVLAATYNAGHLPLTIKDASGQTTTYTYNSFGEVTSTKNPRGETTTFTYDASGYLTQIKNALNGVSAAFTYDGLGRVKTSSDAESYTKTYSYDALDRVTQVSYPDGTADKMTYTTLDMTQATDRLNRVTTDTYDALRHLTAVTDSINRTTHYTYCTCGALKSITDAKGNVTQFVRDVESRITAKIYPDHTQTSYVYDLTGRLASMTDAKNQTTSYSYDQENHLTGITYPAGTPNVTFTYDAPYGRLATMTDGIGTTTYSYVQAGQNGALQLAREQKPTGYGTVTFNYDELGRPLSRRIDGLVETVAYDSLGRITASANSLGNFNFGYAGSTDKMASMSYPNGQTFSYTYFGDASSRRLQEIKQVFGGNVVSDQRFQYNAIGEITNWQQKNGPLVDYNWTLGYDDADQLSTVTPTAATTAPNVSQGFMYDAAGNCTQDMLAAGNRAATYNNLNELTTLAGSGGSMPFVYDFNGNRMSKNGVSNPSATYSWDAANRLVAIAYNQTGQTITGTQFSYDGLGRMIRLIEKSGVNTVQERHFVWLGDVIYQERDAQNTLVKQFFGEGFKTGKATASTPAGSYYYGRDHLTSITNLTDSTGAVRSIDSYDPYGQKYHISGNVSSDLGYAGLFHHAQSSLDFGTYRAYDPSSKTWLSRDPAGEQGGINLFEYVSNNPIWAIDPQGLNLLVIVGDRKTGSWNIFGHISIAVTGQGLYSFGNGTPFGSNVDLYLTQQSSSRDQQVYEIPTSSQQDQAAMVYLSSQKDDIGKLDNCANRTYNALRAAKIPVLLIPSGYGSTPGDVEGLLQALVNAGAASETTITKGSSNIPLFPMFNPNISHPIEAQ